MAGRPAVARRVFTVPVPTGHPLPVLPSMAGRELRRARQMIHFADFAVIADNFNGG